MRFLLGCVALAACGVSAPAQQMESAAGPRYEVFVQGSAEEAQELVRLCEAAWPILVKRLQCEPKLAKKTGGPVERLRVKLFASKDDLDSGTLLDGKARPDFADPVWSCIDLRTVYARRCDTGYLTRAAVLYGLVLQFHGVAKPKNKDLDQTWYMSGMAHELSIHRFDDSKLELGVRPTICDVDYPAEGLKLLGDGPLPGKTLTEERLFERPLACGLMRFLYEGQGGKYKKRLEKLALGSTGSKVSGIDFLTGLGDLDHVAVEMQQYLRDTQLDFAIESGFWEDTGGGTIVASAKPTMETVCRLRRECNQFDLKLRIPVDGTSGVVVGWTGPGDYFVTRYAPPKLLVERYEKGRLTNTVETPVEDKGSDVVAMSFRRAQGKVGWMIEGAPPVIIDAPRGTFGLAAENGRAVFEAVSWR